MALTATLLAGSVALPLNASASTVATSATRNPAGTTIVEDTDSAWVYSGSWTHDSGQPWTQPDHGGTESYSNEPGARATLQFFGTDATLYAPMGPNMGTELVSLDCQPPTSVDLYAPQKTYQKPIAVFTGLVRGAHTIVVMDGPKSAQSSDSYAAVDYASVADNATPISLTRPAGAVLGPSATSPITLRRAGCGAASDLLQQASSRLTTGALPVPAQQAAGSFFVLPDNSWSADTGSSPAPAQLVAATVNAHSVSGADGPITVDGAAAPSINIPVRSAGAQLPLSLPDKPRTLVLQLAADSVPDASVDVQATDEHGTPITAWALTGVGARPSASGGSSPVTLQPGQSTVLAVDLRGGNGAGARTYVALHSWTTASRSGELDVVAGRTSDLSAARYVDQLAAAPVTGFDPNHMAAPMSAFSHGSVVLSRVLADSDQPAWSEPSGVMATPAPVSIGTTSTGMPTRSAGTALNNNTISLTVPDSGAATIHLETGRFCRSLSFAAAVDDSTPSGVAASASISVTGDGGVALPMSHNGVWSSTSVLTAGLGYDPETWQRGRAAVVSQYLAAQGVLAGQAGAAAGSVDGPGVTAGWNAAARTVANQLTASVSDPAQALMTFPTPNPVVIGAGSTVGAQAPTAWQDANNRTGATTPLPSTGAVPLSVDLITPAQLATAKYFATHSTVGASGMLNLLSNVVDVSVSGAPGVVVDLADAGMDCVSQDQGAVTAEPLYSQLGVLPAFLPAPVDAQGSELSTLAANPLWFNTMCPLGPSVNPNGLHYSASRTRTTYYTAPNSDVAAVVMTEASIGSFPSCGLPADQLAADSDAATWGAWTVTSGHPTSLSSAWTQVADPIPARVTYVLSDWIHKVLLTITDAAYRAATDKLSLALWWIFAPLDWPFAIIFNPITMQLLPWQAQLAGSVAYLGAGLAAGSLLNLPAASTSTAAGTALGAAGRIAKTALLSAADAKAAITAGKELALADGNGGRFGIELGIDTNGNTTASITTDLKTTKTITDDPATTKLPDTNGQPAFAKEPVADTAATSSVVDICRRSTEMICPAGAASTTAEDYFASDPRITNSAASTSSQGALPNFWGGGNRAWMLDESGKMTPQPGQNFFDRYAGATWGVATKSQTGAWNAAVTLNGDIAVMKGIPSDSLFVTNNGVREPVVMRTDRQPVYYFATTTPQNVFDAGLAPYNQDAATAALAAGDPKATDLTQWVRDPPDQSVWFPTTRDPSMPTAAAQNEQFMWHWRYEIVTPGGGADVSETYRSLGMSPGPARTESEVSFPGGIDTAYIARADLIDVRPDGTSYVRESLTNPNFDVGRATGGAASDPSIFDTPTPREAQADRTVGDAFDTSPQSTYYADKYAFDFPQGGTYPGVDSWTLPQGSVVPVPDPALLTDAAVARIVDGDAFLVWTKSRQKWELLDGATTELSAGYLANPVSSGKWAELAKFVPITETLAPGRTVQAWVPPLGSNRGLTWSWGTSTTIPAPAPVKRQADLTGTFELRSVSSPTSVLQETGEQYAPYGTNTGAHPVVASPSSWHTSAQQWRVSAVGDGTYYLYNVATGDALHCAAEPYLNTSTASGSFTVVASPSSWQTPEQRWVITTAADGSIELVNVGHPNSALQNTGDGYLGIAGVTFTESAPAASNSVPQQWTLQPVS